MAISTMMLTLLAPVSVAAQAPAARPAAFEDYGTFTAATETDDGTIWLKLWQPHVRYRIGKQPQTTHDALFAVIKQAVDGARSVTIRFDGGHGAFNSATGTLDYKLCSITLDDRRVEAAGPCDSALPADATGFVPVLAVARARMLAGDFEGARQLLSRLDMPADVGARKLLLRQRGDALAAIADALPPLSAAADRALAASLADERALAALDPSDADPQFEIAGTLVELGAYPEARAIYTAILAKWPDEEYRVAVRLGALQRAQGDYAKALQPLDDLVARKGPQPGMRFHYHRGWTLSLLGRYDEAIRELNEGLKDQPDYHSAYQRRACAWAALGDTRSALADLDEAERLLKLVPGGQSIKALRQNGDEIVALRTRLQGALAAGDAKPIRNACTGTSWDRWEHPRPRSPLVPPHAS